MGVPGASAFLWAAEAAPVPEEEGGLVAEEASTSTEGTGGTEWEDPFRKGAMNVQFQGAFYREAWGYNGHVETLAGGSAAFGWFFLDRLSLNLELELLGARQECWDTFLGGLALIPRWHFFSRGAFSLFFDAGTGFSIATRFLPEPNGTRFNFLILSSVGVTWRVSRSVLLTGCFRYLHLSNASINGNDRNPDIDSLGGQFGVLIPF